MRKVWLVAFALALFGATPAAFTQTAPPSNDVAAICHRCEWIQIQIGDIDEKIASWERQIRSINKYSNRSDPNIQNALKDIDNKIAALKAKKADLEAQLTDCKKSCAEAQQAAPKPATLPPSGGAGIPQGGGNTGGTPSESGPGADNGQPGSNSQPPPDCPGAGGAAGPNGVAGSEPGAIGPSRLDPEYPITMPKPPEDRSARENWDHLQDHMDDAEGPYGDDVDVLDVTLDIQIAISDAMNEIVAHPNNKEALMRLVWLRRQETYYGEWKAWIKLHWTVNGEFVDPHNFLRCPLLELPWEKTRTDKSNGDSAIPLGDFSIGAGGFGMGGGRVGSHHGNSSHTNGTTTLPDSKTTPTVPTAPTSSDPSTH